MVLILYTKIEQRLAETQFQAFLQPLPSDIREKARRYRRWQDAQACLLGKVLLIESLQRFGLDGATLIHQLQYSDHGRPYLPEAIDFNISHSGACVVCALSTNGLVGIDIEKVNPITLTDFRSQMTDAEWTAVTTASDPLRAFFYYWTRKEAAIKAHGHGLSLPLKEVRISKEAVIMDDKAWPLFEIPLYPEYICHLVTEERMEQADIQVEKVVFH